MCTSRKSESARALTNLFPPTTVALSILGLLWAFFEAAMWHNKRKNKRSSSSEAGLNNPDSNEKFGRITSATGASEASGPTGPTYPTDNAQWARQNAPPGNVPPVNQPAYGNNPN